MDKLQTVERQIVNKLVSELLKGGWMVSVNDGEETVLVNSKKRKEILNAMFSTDEDYLYVSHPNRSKSWVRLIHGNEEDIISDHGVSISDIIDPIYDWINKKIN